ncbi:DUF397 domain-containing protein [Streptomyces cavernicola]|uniref:DUF397 domain-containing protein n=1 Tax=Streptomyces cavernicola TaxID=3043613 RepID=A0ABT6SEN1_9ACTN|nr:DUF397 domain-containing protein [Streptomyces sp. B-S-A6]MDI3406309.1 DUF397 domain-containing protein [Streptomyces sp. B-S-A6]
MRTYDLSNARWQKSSYSNASGGECVEVARNVPAIVPVRDSKQTDGPVLIFPAESWTAFVTETRTAHP